MKEMKRFIRLMIVIYSLGMLYAHEKIIQPQDLPKDIQTYIQKHFPLHKILWAEEEAETFSVSYEIRLDNNIKLEFEGTVVKEIKSAKALPASVIPEKIAKYVSTHYTQHYITEWELDNLTQQITLNNGLELEFDINGIFIRFDD